MQKYLIAILFLFLTFNAVAQYDIPMMEAASDTWRLQKMKNGESFIHPEAIAGNPYLNKDFKEGKLISKYNLKFPVLPLRYNIYTDNIEYKSPDNKIFALKDQNKIKAYEIGDTTFIYSSYYKNKSKIASGYFQVLVTGKVTGLIKYNVYLLEAQPERPYREAKPKRFSKIAKSFYVKVADGAAVPVTKEKEFLQLFPSQKNQLNQFIKKEKLHIQKQDDFVKLVNYYNSLVSKK